MDSITRGNNMSSSSVVLFLFVLSQSSYLLLVPCSRLVLSRADFGVSICFDLNGTTVIEGMVAMSETGVALGLQC